MLEDLRAFGCRQQKPALATLSQRQCTGQLWDGSQAGKRSRTARLGKDRNGQQLQGFKEQEIETVFSRVDAFGTDWFSPFSLP